MLRVIHLGLGDIGKLTIHSMLAQPKHLKLVAVVDPAFAGKNLRDLMGKSAPSLPVHASLKEALKRTPRPDLATVTTASTTLQIQKTLEQLIDARLHVASTCEELAFPDLRNKKIAAALDKRARKNKVALIGTGVNPGFAMDAFALACTAPCSLVRKISILRSLDAGQRRQQLQIPHVHIHKPSL